MKQFKKLSFLLLILAAIISGCQEEPLPEPKPDDNEEVVKEEAPALTQRVNQFIKDAMTDIYLWYDKIPDVDIRYEFDSEKYFDKLLFTEDKWSYITKDVKALENSFEGVETSFGYSLTFGRFTNSDGIFAIVEYVYPNTPAAEAGLKRGDALIQLNGADITDNTYMELLNGGSINLTKGINGPRGISAGDEVSMVSRELQLNPVLKTKVIEHEGHKIGYLMYAQFISEYNSSLDTALQHFKDEQITDLVLDLRYNPGGGTDAAQHLCSAVAPLSVVDAGSPLITYQWNNKYQQYWKSQGEDDQLGVNFRTNVPVKLGLDKIHILTGPGTASASEFTITGLTPYMNVTTVGETTYGKYTASITMKPEYFYEDSSFYSNFKNWGIQPIVIRYANSQGVTDFKEGFTPNIPVTEDLFDGIPLGDKNESLLRAAIEDITGTKIVAQKSAKITPRDYTFFDRGFSKFDVNKREMLIENLDKQNIFK